MDKTFLRFIREQRQILWLTIPVMLIEFVVFKAMYPFANFLYDSTFYIYTAYKNDDLGIWPVAYSKFLQIFRVFTASDLALVTFQFLLLEGAILYFYFTLLYFMKPAKWVQWLILSLMVVNPAVLSISNYILSDSIFTALTLIWFSLMIWYICKPRSYYTYILGILLFFLFILRYYAVFYPLLTYAIILISRIPQKAKAISIGLSIILLTGYIENTENQYYRLIRQREFSSFLGWQMAGNALIMYRHFHEFSGDQPPSELASLHQLVIHQLDSFSRLNKRPDSTLQVFYMWDEESPLKIYMKRRYQNDPPTPYVKKWSSMGPYFKDYGLYLIKRHPLAYIKYYIGLNIKWFAFPADEALKIYNSNQDSVSTQIKEWFHYPSRRVSRISKIIYPAKAYPFITAVMNALVVICLIIYFLIGPRKKFSREFKMIIQLFTSFWIINFFFSIISAPILLRYELSIILLDMGIGLILLQAIVTCLLKKASTDPENVT
ncbi:hypothetical protein [Dinghuibacter silviterrae]|uniref:Dolichyl-phosphate-mannose-protein mannosyltransferase n=1 Tax=Dinghuibacter silviterrae TaxID=1539049 RepID=A0A4R8DWG5_9BACT|nr:hypothetical protein [Dinghuibacter silviterrae]TDX01845.1 hypothetical protein EDB95_2889 [Dinghuibacter silviterrae]